MSIRPIDMQVAVRGSGEAGTARQNVLNRQENQILNAQQQAVAERQREANKVNTDIRAEEAEIKRRMKEEHGGGKRDKQKKSSQKKQKSEEGKAARLPGEKGSILDIRI